MTAESLWYTILPFLKVETSQPNVAEIFSVYDAEGHRYYEVEFLSQDTIYRDMNDRTSEIIRMIDSRMDKLEGKLTAKSTYTKQLLKD